MSMASTCGRNRIVSFTGQSVIWWIYAIIYYSSGSIKTPCVSFTWHPYTQLKGIIAMLIAVCSCTHCQKVSLASNDRYRVLIQRQCLETFKISTKTGPVYWRLMIYHQPQGLRCVLHTNTHSHTHLIHRCREGSLWTLHWKKGIHRAWAAYIRIRLIRRA